jgi:hypothetical protein
MVATRIIRGSLAPLNNKTILIMIKYFNVKENIGKVRPSVAKEDNWLGRVVNNPNCKAEE